jgi:hypothetical protein
MAIVLRVLACAALVVVAGGWTEPQVLEPKHTFSFAQDGNGAGERFLAWDSEDGIRVAVARRGRAFGRPRVVPGPPGGGVQVAADARGNALIVWRYHDGSQPPVPPGHSDIGCCNRVVASILRADGRLTRARTLSPRGLDAYKPRVAVAGDGRFALLGLPDRRVRFGWLRRGSFGRLETLPGHGYPLSVTFGRRYARVQYQRRSREGEPELGEVRRTGPSRYSRPRSIATKPFRQVAPFEFDARGRQLTLFAVPEGDAERNELGIRSPPGELRTMPLSPYQWGPALALAPSGAALVAWSGQVMQRGPNGEFGQPVPIDASGSALDAAAAPAGGGAVAYGSPFGVRVSVVDANGKVLTSRGLPEASYSAGFTDVYADSRGTSAVWLEGTTERLLATRSP